MTEIMSKEQSAAMAKARADAMNGGEAPLAELPAQGETTLQDNKRLEFDPRRSIVYMHVAVLVEAARLAHELLGALMNNPKYEHTPSVMNKATKLQDMLKELAPADNNALMQVIEQMLAIAAPGVDFVSSGVGVLANISEKKIILRAEILQGKKMVHMPMDKEGAEKIAEAIAAALDKIFPERLVGVRPKLIV